MRWFCKENKNNSIETKKVKNDNNYEINEKGDIKIQVLKQGIFCKYRDIMVIPKNSIICHKKDVIIFKSYTYRQNFKPDYSFYCEENTPSYDYSAIIYKRNFIKYKDTHINVYEYFKEDEGWKLINSDEVGTEVISERTPKEIFTEEFNSQFCLIETKDEFNNYMKSNLDFDTWCRKKLYNKMKELGLGNVFINQFADLIGNDRDKYHQMIELA